MALIKCGKCKQHYTAYGMDKINDPEVGSICVRCGNDARFFSRWWNKFRIWCTGGSNGK